ncbi:YozE family protein [Ectobacillus sp. JY-23]|uniref:YozE family protein n=1 Tax=Ectobacillus sp. JY-23 TaxID=2933872 RepID=UPI001FF11B79|nr:YozE family protein [Ectobacillus sp. JY-23]UOY92941.1 YozE family protein [Ectobacillus sp. JY-23]
MTKSFYHYMMKYRDTFQRDDLSDLAQIMYEDHSFPKQSNDYEEISSYLELSGLLPNMSVFDSAWEYYLQAV